MKRSYESRPLKAYRITYGGEPLGIYVGRTSGQAKYNAVLECELLGYNSRDEVFSRLNSGRVGNPERERLAVEEYEDRGKYWKHTRAYARLQAEVDAFNDQCPVGSPVQIIDCCEASQWPNGMTRTRTPAWIPCKDTAMVSVEGEAGGMYLKYVKPVAA